ncbi:MAG: ABC transporter ATP-binding protein [Nitrospirota bacterium]|nr:ABC transporter ATP-binding protein [Nitrospirota bacterium]
MPILEINQLTKRFGGLIAVGDVSFAVEAGEILSVIGPNGAGKSTLFKLISSFLRATSGEVIYDGENITAQAPHLVARKGVVRTFQETTIFREMTARDNVVVAHHLRSQASLAGFYVGSKAARQDEADFRASAEEILDYLGLGHVKDETARNLPHGYLRALGMAVGLAAQPKILLLDEPFAGMNHEETAQAVQQVYGIRDRGVTVLLVEHDMSAVMKISDRIVVLNFGKKIAEGTPNEIQNDESVIEAYLGREDDEIGV